MTETVDLTVRGGTVYIGTIQDPEVQEKLTKGTSYRPVGMEYTQRFRQRNRASATSFDGRVKLVKHSKCPIGLLPRVTDILIKAGVKVHLTRDPELNEAQKIESRIDGLDDRSYQHDAAGMTVLNDRGIIRAPTGSGKSAILTEIIHIHQRAALVIVPTVDLLYQTKAFLDEHLCVWDGLQTVNEDIGAPGVAYNFQPIGQLGDKVVDPQMVTVATIRTIAKVLEVAYEPYVFAEFDDKEEETAVDPRALRAWVKRLGVVIVDECQLLGADVLFEVTNKIPAKNKYGMSASPWRDDGADLRIEAATGPVFYRIEPKVLVEQGFLVPPLIRVISTQSWWTAGAWGKICKRCGRQAIAWQPKCECGSTEFKSQFQECYKQEIVENDIRNARIAQEVIDLDCATLVLVKQIKHGRSLQALIPDSVFLSGKEKGPEREKAFQQVRDGELRVIICTQIADMGLDLPILGALVLAGGGKSSVRHLQRIGRVVRPYEGKKCGLVLDFDDRHVASWFGRHEEARRKIEKAEWQDCAIWI